MSESFDDIHFLDMGIELKGEGYYILAPGSVVDGNPYLFKSSLDYLQSFPERFLAEVKPEIQPRFHLPRGTATQGASCIEQIANRDIKEGERDKALFILSNLLVQNGNNEDFTRAVVTAKNKSLSNPLPRKELEWVWKKIYKLSCQYVRENLAYINCDNCRYLDRRCKVNNLLIQCHGLHSDLSGTEHKVLNFIQYYFNGTIPSTSKLSRVTKMDWRIVDKAVKNLKNKGILN